MLAEIAKYGGASVKRAYGDWTTPNLKSWKEYLHKHAIQPIQQFRYTVGKNSSDSSLIIDAMDLLHEGRLDGFCLISSDSDFTRLATRIREAGLLVYGFGEKKTPQSFISGCDKFIFTEILRHNPEQDESTNEDLKSMVISAISAVSKDDGWASVGGYMIKNNPSFDSRNYGYIKMGKLIKSLGYVDFKDKNFTDGSNNVHIYVRILSPLQMEV